MVFRWALKAIAEGVYPDDPKWSVHWDKTQTSSMLAALNGPLPSLGHWRQEMQYAIQGAVRGFNLSNIISAAPFPDWLGYLGILLRYTEGAENENLMLTNEIVPQLIFIIEPGTPAESKLRQCIEMGSPIRWKDLELVERHYCGARTSGDAG